ncbi:hypothetical protein PC116_g16950 [Phytophthora cactorum]|nr:hypothetical protein PC115_g11092 [Phytophthora cactorum]KAG2979484.1 hypothetical protein PC118_g11733 [Phytophthora cactorum]KAG3015247.1 hypothetical protein PC120_g12265 [Phytophthora cactorum]KAG3182886.1 hypothetical protein PC128_g14464 [Phytophthora cactorum]KAG4234900.1 hypothetical protein PC116_g16950 [Phytophthora cactorum]
MPTTWATPPELHTSRYSRDDVRDSYSPPPSSGLSSEDEDAEYGRGVATRTGPVYLRRAPEQGSSRKMDITRTPARVEAYRDNTASRYSSTSRPSRFPTHPRDTNERFSLSQPENSDEVYVTTMDEEDQQMFIALFYWRRRVIETHFSAWKWVAFTLRRSAKKIHRHGMNTRPSNPIPMRYDSTGLRPPRRNLILKRHTGMSSAEESDKGVQKLGVDSNDLKRDTSQVEIQCRCIQEETRATTFTI